MNKDQARNFLKGEGMTLNAFQLETMRTASMGRTPEWALAIFGLGIGGEAGEVQDLVKKHLGHGHPLDKEKLVKELGDVLWYVAAIADQAGVSLEMVAQVNVEKLRKRYPNGFSSEASLNRKAEDK